MSTIVAIGGGEIADAETEPIDAHVRDLAGTETPAALFVPTASGDADGYCETFDAYYGDRLGCETRHLTLLDGDDDPARIRDALDWAELVYVGGGRLPLLLDTWREAGVDELLREARRDETIVAGLSAGAMCWFEAGLTDASDDVVDCLGWVDGLSYVPHATRERRRALRDSLDPGEAGLAVEDGAAIEIDDGSYRVRSVGGEEAVYHYRNDDGRVEGGELDERDAFESLTTLV